MVNKIYGVFLILILSISSDTITINSKKLDKKEKAFLMAKGTGLTLISLANFWGAFQSAREPYRCYKYFYTNIAQKDTPTRIYFREALYLLPFLGPPLALLYVNKLALTKAYQYYKQVFCNS